MEKINHIQYLFSDALLLASIALACKDKPAELDEIFAVGDYLNHAIFSFDEIESGLVRLTAGGWIKESNDRSFIVTSKFKKNNFKISNINDVSKLAKTLDALPWDASSKLRDESNNLKYPGITKKIIEKALGKYFEK